MAKRNSVFINGEFLPPEQAKISIFDRGFLMGDAVYEVSAVIGGKMLDNTAHLRRLARSLGELNMALPMSIEELVSVQEALIADNHLDEGIVYIQVTRGSAERDFVFNPNLCPNVVLFTQAKVLRNPPGLEQGLRVMTVPDIRWQRRDIKTTQLLAQSLAKMIARDAGHDDAWLVDEQGNVTEGSSSNAWIIKDGQVITRPLDYDILHGITRATLLHVLKAHGLRYCERAFSVDEAYRADEAFTTSASGLLTPVSQIDGHAISNGRAGTQTLALREAYLHAVCDG